MKKGVLIAISVISVVVLLGGPALAQEKKPFYFLGKAGIYSPQTNDLDGFDTGFNGEIALGWRAHPNFATEFGAGYFNTEASDFGGRINLDVVPITLTLKGILPYEKWDFFALGGVGAYFVSGDIDFSGFDSHDRDTVFGGFLGLGIHYNITKAMFIGVEGKYLWTDRAELKEDFFRTKFKLDGIITNAVFGFKF